MSGAEGAFVIGLISSVILIIEAAKKVYDAAGDAKGQPEAFRQVAAQLPLVIEILRSAKKSASTLDDTVQEASERILKSCKSKAEQLQEIFQKVIRNDDDKWFDRYMKAPSRGRVLASHGICISHGPALGSCTRTRTINSPVRSRSIHLVNAR